ncbi:MAG: PD40 domain-containing protein [Caldilineaceae bacterium]|nr:PD40 domain-containing protein [Caldilineaceae bacterium]
MPSFQLRLLGSFQLTRPDGIDIHLRSDKVRGLLAYLALETPGRPIRRSHLAELFWPGYLAKSARQNLRNALSNLRQVLAPLDILQSDRKTVIFHTNNPDFWCDALDVTRSSAAPQPQPPLLQGFQLEDCPQFMRWLTQRRGALLPQETVQPGRWQAIPDHPHLVGRAAELALLHGWLAERGRLVGIFGMGGQGKTTLAAAFARSIGEEPNFSEKRGSSSRFTHILWSSLLNAPTWQNVLAEWVAALSGQPDTPIPDHLDGQLALLMGLVSQRPTLFVLDNLETILESEEMTGRFRPGYTAFDKFLETMAQTVHPSAVLLTSREQPARFGRWQQSHSGVHALVLAGLDDEAGSQLLGEHLAGPPSEIASLVRHFSGNPLALLLIGRTVSEIFGDDVTAFLRLDKTVFGDVRDVLAAQFARLSGLEQQILFQLAVAREPVAWPVVQRNLPSAYSPIEMLDGVRSLLRRSLLEVQTGGVVGFSAANLANSRFGLQNVILEFVSARLVEELADGIENRKTGLLAALTLLRADTPHYIREMQQRLILQPIRERLAAQRGEAATGRQLRVLLDDLRRRPYEQVGAAAVNLLHLLLGLTKAIEGADFSALPLPNAYLRGVKARDVNLAGTDLTGSAFIQMVGLVRGVAVHPAGHQIAACTRDGSIWLWQMPEQTVSTVPGSPQNQCNEVAFSPDGSLLAYGSVDGFVRVWELQANRLYGKIAKGNGGAFAFSPDGKVIAGCEADEVWFWDVATRGLLPSLPGSGAALVALAFCPDSERVISTYKSGIVSVWEWRQARLVRTWRGARAEILHLSVHPDGQRIAAIIDGDVIMWNMQGQPLSPLLTGESHFLQVAFSPTGEWLVGSGYNGHVYIWQTQTGHCVRLLRGHTQATGGLAFFPHGRWLATGSADQSVRIWDVESGHQLHELPGYKCSIATLALAPNGESLACAGNSGSVHLWQLASGEVAKEWSAHEHRIASLVFHPAGRLLASGSADHSVRLWDAENGHQVNLFWGHDWGVERMLFHPRLPLLISASLDGMLCLWNVEAGHLIGKLKAHDQWISDIVFSPDGTLLATCGGDQKIHLWSLSPDSTLARAGEISVPDTKVGYGPLVAFLGSQRLAFGTQNGIYIYDLAESRVRAYLSGHDKWVMGLTSSSDGAWLASTGVEKSLRLWEGESGRLRWAVDLQAPVESLAFSPDSRQLYTGNLEGDVEVWDATNGALLRRMQPPGPYAGMNIRGATGISEAQRASLLALGAVEG